MAPAIPDLNDLANLSHPAFVNLLKTQGNYKERSQTTFADVHKSELEALNKTSSTKDESKEFGSSLNKNPRSLLIGDSLLERIKILLTPPFQTTFPGSSAFEHLKSFPPGSAQLQLTTLPSSINFVCGGDKIENVLYRLYAGTYRPILLFSPSIKLIILQVGTNNLRPLRPLTESECAKYSLLLAALLKIAPDAALVCSGLFNRRDIPDGVVGASNDALKKVVESLKNAEVGNWTGRGGEA